MSHNMYIYIYIFVVLDAAVVISSVIGGAIKCIYPYLSTLFRRLRWGNGMICRYSSPE